MSTDDNGPRSRRARSTIPPAVRDGGYLERRLAAEADAHDPLEAIAHVRVTLRRAAITPITPETIADLEMLVGRLERACITHVAKSREAGRSAERARARGILDRFAAAASRYVFDEHEHSEGASGVASRIDDARDLARRMLESGE